MSIFQTPKFPAVKDSLHAELKKRVQSYFDEKGIASSGNKALFTKAIILVAAFIATYIHLIFFMPHWYIAIPECMLLGILMAAIGFNVMHDGSHGSFSKHKWKNKLATASLNMLGANHFMWNMKHNMLHHSFTNVDGVDDDIEVGVFMRMAPTQKRYWLHRFQHFYFWFLYMMLYVFWIFFTDYQKYFLQRIGKVPLKKMTTKDHIGFWVTKLYHGFIFIALPIIMVGWFYWLMGFLIATLTSGLVLSIVFQLAHTVEDAHFPIADFDSKKLPEEFAIHQIKTTANFATKNKFISWLLGGLNFQIEHHLFPKISHVHYPAISNIVKSVCMEYQLKYIEYPTMSRAVVAHIRLLRQLGKYD